MPKSKPVNYLCIYRVKKGKERQFKAVLKEHWPAMKKVGIATKVHPQVWRGKAKGKTVLIELSQWKDAAAIEKAHRLPEIMAVWEPIGNLTESMEFIEVESERE